MKYKICSALILFFSFLFVIYGDAAIYNIHQDFWRASNGNLFIYWLPNIFNFFKLIYGVVGLDKLLKRDYKNAIIILGALFLDGYAHIIGVTGIVTAISQ